MLTPPSLLSQQPLLGNAPNADNERWLAPSKQLGVGAIGYFEPTLNNGNSSSSSSSNTSSGSGSHSFGSGSRNSSVGRHARSDTDNGDVTSMLNAAPSIATTLQNEPAFASITLGSLGALGGLGFLHGLSQQSQSGTLSQAASLSQSSHGASLSQQALSQGLSQVNT